MSLDRLTTIAFLLTYVYGIITVIASADITSALDAVIATGKLVVLTVTYGGVTWFLIWLDHTYYPQHYQDGDRA